MESITAEVRRESYQESKQDFNDQELSVLANIKCGFRHAWNISEHSDMLITSVRRALNSLVKKNIIEVSGKVFYHPTNRKISTYRIVKYELF